MGRNVMQAHSNYAMGTHQDAMHIDFDPGPRTVPSALCMASTPHEQPASSRADATSPSARGSPGVAPAALASVASAGYGAPAASAATASANPASAASPAYGAYAISTRSPAHALAVELEANEGAAYRSLFEVAAALHGAAAFSVLPLDGASVFVSPPMRKPGVFNRVLGLGLGAPTGRAALQGLRDSFERQGCTPAFDLVPQWLSAADLDALRGTRIRRAAIAAVLYRWLPASTSAKCLREPTVTSTDAGAPAHTAWESTVPSVLPVSRPMIGSTNRPVVHVVPARGAQCRTAAAICAEVFAMPEAIESVLAALHSQPGWQLWLAFVDGQAAGAALSFTRGRRCWFGWDATLPAYRGRGVKGALDDVRIAAAQAAGCSLISTDTDIGTAAAPDLSLRSLRRRGFEIAYLRATYLPVPKAARTGFRLSEAGSL